MNTLPGPVLGEGDGIVVGIRPEHLVITDPAADPGRRPRLRRDRVGRRVTRSRAPRDLPRAARGDRDRAAGERADVPRAGGVGPDRLPGRGRPPLRRGDGEPPVSISRRRRREALFGYLLLVPALLIFCVFVFYPFLKNFQLGFYLNPPFPNLPSRYVGFAPRRGSADGSLLRRVRRRLRLGRRRVHRALLARAGGRRPRVAGRSRGRRRRRGASPRGR